jgi:hypothetical protein
VWCPAGLPSLRLGLLLMMLLLLLLLLLLLRQFASLPASQPVIGAAACLLSLLIRHIRCLMSSSDIVTVWYGTQFRFTTKIAGHCWLLLVHVICQSR